MTMFERVKRSLNNPAIPLSSDAIISLLGAGMTTDAGINVSEYTAMRHAAVWRCVTLLAGTIAQLPLKTYREQAGVRTEIDTPLLRMPYPDLTAYEFFETVMLHILLWGNAYILKIPTEAGDSIARLLPLSPWTVQVKRLPANGSLGAAVGGKYGRKVFLLSAGSGDPLTSDEILHIPGVGYDGVRGLSPIAHMRNAIGGGLAAEEFGGRLFGSGSLMSGVLTSDTKLTEDQADRLKIRFREKTSGLARSHEVAILDAGLKFVPISISPEDAQFIETRKFSVTDICRFYGVAPHLVSDLDKTSSWGAGIAEQSLGLVRYTLSHYIARIEQRITADPHILPAGTFSEFLLEGILRGDTAARYEAYAIALQNRWMNPAEVRRIENMAPGPPELDEFAPSLPPAAKPIAGVGKTPKDV